MKKCRVCGIEKEVDDFYLSKGFPEGKCKMCKKQKSLQRYYECPGVKEKLMESIKQKRMKEKVDNDE